MIKIQRCKNEVKDPFGRIYPPKTYHFERARILQVAEVIASHSCTNPGWMAWDKLARYFLGFANDKF